MLSLLLIVLPIVAATLRGDDSGGRVLDAAESDALVVANQPGPVRILMVSQNLANTQCAGVDFNADFQRFRGPAGQCTHPIIVINTQEGSMTGTEAKNFAHGIFNACGYRDGAARRAAYSYITNWAGQMELKVASLGASGYVVTQRVYVSTEFYRNNPRSFVTNGGDASTTPGDSTHFTKKVVRSALHFCLGHDRREPRLFGDPECPTEQVCRVQIIGGHLPMSPGNNPATYEVGASLPHEPAPIVSPTRTTFSQFGLDNRDTAMANIHEFLRAGAFANTDTVLLTGDTNFRVDNVGEQLKRKLSDPNAEAYRGWQEMGLPSYYTCRFAENDKRVNQDLQSYLDCRAGRNGLARPPVVPVPQDYKRTQFNYAILNDANNLGDFINPVTGNLMNGVDSNGRSVRDAHYRDSERYDSCGRGRNDAKNRPLGFCDRVLYRSGDNTRSCPYHVNPQFTAYESLSLCSSSDHNAIVAEITLNVSALDLGRPQL